MILPVVALLLASLHADQSADAQQILTRVAAADSANRKHAAWFVFQELIVNRDVRPSGEVTNEGRRNFEVTFLEDEIYHRLTQLNGVPLDDAREVEEERRYQEAAAARRAPSVAERRRRGAATERQRLKLSLSVLAAHHTARIVRTEGPVGDERWVLYVEPKRNAPKPRQPDEWALALRGYLIVDQRTGHPVEARLEQVRGMRSHPKGTQALFRWRQIEGVWLIDRIESVRPVDGRKGWRSETIQTYSNYRRFRIETIVLYDDESP